MRSSQEAILAEMRRWGYRFVVTPTLEAVDTLRLGLGAEQQRRLFKFADGDGSVLNYTHAPTKRLYPNYRYERLVVHFNTASKVHAEWLRAKLEPIIGRGNLAIRAARPPRHEFYTLRYGKAASLKLLGLLYADADSPRLIRKWQTWHDYVRRHSAEAELA